MNLKKFTALLTGVMSVFSVALAQGNSTLSAVLQDASTAEAVGFATVSITKPNATKPYKYALSTSEGKVSLTGVASGKYVLKAELMGYKTFTKDIEVKGNTDLGVLKMEQDVETLKAASVSAAGNPIIIKKDTVEYNASSFKTTDNDKLEDLLKKLPGVEVAEDGSVTANGETISKITIDGKTFFLDDPQLATKNLPAKIIEKVKVVQKKSDQAEFTGIDDGEEETVIDLSVHKGMMRGMFGNVSAGGGHDIPTSTTSSFGSDNGDFRYQGGAFVGKFTDKSQISLILNANNTNNRGFSDLSGDMMQGMRGGMGNSQGGWGSGNGITESWMGGLNGSWTLFDDKMDLGANYVFSKTEKSVEEQSRKITYLDDGSFLDYRNGLSSPGYSITNTNGHRFGARIEHKFSDNTSIIFQPQVNFGTGDYRQFSDFETYSGSGTDYVNGELTNSGFTNSVGDNSNWTTNGFLLFRQKLGIPGRTLSFMGNYSFSGNNLDGFNQSLTSTVGDDGVDSEIVNQRIDRTSNSASLSGRIVYTEPLGKGFYASANYSYSWSRNKSDKDTYDSGSNTILYDSDNNAVGLDYARTGEYLNTTYSSNILNEYNNQSAGVDLQYQKEKLRAQIGMSIMPTDTHNETTSNGSTDNYDNNVVNWAPSAMLMIDFSENSNMRLFYRGSSGQPTTSQLMPVPDNSDPLDVSLGNPYLTPYFTHSLRGDFRYSNKQTFTTFSARFSGSLVNDPIVNAVWYDQGGVQYTIPVNGPSSGNASLRMNLTSPIAKSNFSVFIMSNASYSQSSSYIGKNSLDMSKYLDDEGVFSDYDAFHDDYGDLGSSSDFTKNKTQSMTLTERIRLTYRNDFVELVVGGRTRLNRSWYSMESATDTKTWNNQLNGEMTWTIPGGFEFRTQANYNWYRGYTTDQDDEIIVNAELNKTLFTKFTLAVRGYDIFDQAKNLSVTDSSNYHQEVLNNTLGRYVIVALTYRFGTFSGGNNRRGPGGPGGPGGPPPPRM